MKIVAETKTAMRRISEKIGLKSQTFLQPASLLNPFEKITLSFNADSLLILFCAIFNELYAKPGLFSS